MRMTFRRVAVFGGVAMLVAAGCGSSSKGSSATTQPSGSTGSSSGALTASAPGITPTTITLGFVSTLTGSASSSFVDSAGGAQARIDLQNAEGGIDGRKIQLDVADDQSSPSLDQTAVQNLVENKHVFGIIDYSSFAYGGTKYLQQNNIPVTGGGFDGPEWGEQPYTNMFSYLPPVETPFSGSTYQYSYWGKFLQQIGITKLAGFAYGISPSSQTAVKAILASGNTVGVTNCYSNFSLPFGGVDFTASALAMKSQGCNGAATALVDASDIALAQAIKNSSLNIKVLVGGTGYDQSVLDNSSAATALNGDYMSSAVLFDTAIPGIATMYKALEQYDPTYKAGTIPDYGLYGSYIAADLMIDGLQKAGKNPTRQSFITNLRGVSNYTADGILPSPTTFANFGTVGMLPQTSCQYYVQLLNGKYVNAAPGGGTHSVCGTRFKVPS